MKFSAVILAGGRSQRMGRDKALLGIGGQTLLSRQLGLARQLGAAEVFISGRADTDYTGFGSVVLIDRFANAGPLAGIERALDTISTPLLLALAVDMPALTAPLLEELASHCDENSGAIPRVQNRIEPLAAFYPKSAWRLAATLLEDGSNSAGHFAEGCVRSGSAVYMDLSSKDCYRFANWNTPSEAVSPVVFRPRTPSCRA